MGRQYTLVHEMGYTHDIYAFSNYTGTIGFQGAGLTGGGRLDNTVRYTSPTWWVSRCAGLHVRQVAGQRPPELVTRRQPQL